MHFKDSKKENEYTVTTNLAYLLEILNETSNMVSTQQTPKLNSINFLIVASGKSMIESSLLYGSSESIERKTFQKSNMNPNRPRLS